MQNKMNYQPTKFSFGSTSAIITNIALIIGFDSAVNAKLAIIEHLMIAIFVIILSNFVGKFVINYFR